MKVVLGSKPIRMIGMTDFVKCDGCGTLRQVNRKDDDDWYSLYRSAPAQTDDGENIPYEDRDEPLDLDLCSVWCLRKAVNELHNLAVAQ
jgi:hypothetical protein